MLRTLVAVTLHASIPSTAKEAKSAREREVCTCTMFVTLATFHCDTSPSKAVAPKNMYLATHTN